MSFMRYTVDLFNRIKAAIVDRRQAIGTKFHVPGIEVAGTEAGAGPSYDVICSYAVPIGKRAIVTDLYLHGTGTPAYLNFKIGECTAATAAALLASTNAIQIPKSINGVMCHTHLETPLVIDNVGGAAVKHIVLGFGGLVAGGPVNLATNFGQGSFMGIIE